MPGTPIVSYRPKLTIQPLDELGAPEGAAVDVSCDLASVEISADAAVTSVPTFCGIFQVPGDVETSVSLSVVVLDDTLTRWAPLVGVIAQFNLWDRPTDAASRQFNSQVSFNPGLYGTTEAGEARTVDFDVPALSAVTSAVGAYVPPV